MSGGSQRDLVAQVIIIAAVCFGGWMVFVQPRMQEINRLESLIARSIAMQELMDEKDVEAIASRVANLKSRVRWIRESGHLARDTSRLYEVIMQIASDHDVVVQNLRSDVKSSESTSNRVHLTDIHMTVTGTYESLAAFLDALDGINGFIRPDTLNLTPVQTEGRQFAQARISCQALAFPLPDVLSEFVGEEDADG